MQHLHGETAHGKKQHTTTHAAPEPDDAIRQAQSAEPEEREQVIRQTAYAFYEARGRGDGYALDDWLRAEAQFPLAPPDSGQVATSSSTSD